LIADNYAADMLVLPENDGSPVVLVNKNTRSGEEVSLNVTDARAREARQERRPIWVVIGAPKWERGSRLIPRLSKAAAAVAWSSGVPESVSATARRLPPGEAMALSTMTTSPLILQPQSLKEPTTLSH
jgi:hypothetical protein